MDARRMSVAAVKEGISRGCYELTGVLETGELVIALVSDSDVDLLLPSLKSNLPNEEKLKNTQLLISTKGRPAEEIMQIYNQYTCEKNQRCKSNGLRLREK